VTFPGPAIISGALAFVLVALLTEAMRRLALWAHLVDQPRAERIHVSATPYLGGAAIVCGAVGAVIMVIHPNNPQLLTVIISAISISALGLIDDLRSLGTGIRLTCECLAAAAVVVAGVRITIFAGLPVGGHWMDDIGTVIWIVVITNSYNLLDNMDGAATAIVVSTSLVLATLALAVGRPGFAGLLLAVSAGCAGFLVHNWTPARIFMGDAGSLFLGFIMAASTVLLCSSIESSGAPFASVACAMYLMMFVAIVDTCTVLVSRRRAGRRWNQGGGDHIAHRLCTVGFGTSRTVLVLAITAAVTAILGSVVVSGIVPAEALLAVTLGAGVTVVVLAQRVNPYLTEITTPAGLRPDLARAELAVASVSHLPAYQADLDDSARVRDATGLRAGDIDLSQG